MPACNEATDSCRGEGPPEAGFKTTTENRRSEITAGLRGPALPGGGLQKIAMSKSKTPETLSEKVCWNGRYTCEAAM
jgi:hypothetical protein